MSIRAGNPTEKRQQANGMPSAGQPQRQVAPGSSSHQSPASDLLQLRDALQTLPPSVAEAISRHVSCTNEALQKAEAERRAMMSSLADAQSQLAVLPQLQVGNECNKHCLSMNVMIVQK